MAGLIVAALLMASSLAPVGQWHCSNGGLAEISCTEEGCSKNPEFTPMEVHLADGMVQLCAYSACMEGEPGLVDARGPHLILTSDLKREGPGSAANPPESLAFALDPQTGAAVALWGSFAVPMRCTRG